MIRILHRLAIAPTAPFRHTQRLVLAKLFAPLDDAGAGGAEIVDGGGQDFMGEAGGAVVLKGKLVLMGERTAFQGAAAHSGWFSVL